MLDIQHEMSQLIQTLSAGSRVTPAAYDTAWLARLDAKCEMFNGAALEWLRENQLPDGAWGSQDLCYHHDRVICTLAALVALGERGDARDHERMRRAQAALAYSSAHLQDDAGGATAGFEMLAPMLAAEAESLGLLQLNDKAFLEPLSAKRARKLAQLPDGKINRYTTVAYSVEMVGKQGIHLLDVENLLEANGSVACSPAATAFFLLAVREEPCAIDYLRAAAPHGAAPDVTPIDIFERAWTLHNFSLDDAFSPALVAQCRPILDQLAAVWRPTGVAYSSQYSVEDADDTAMTYLALIEGGRSVTLAAILAYENAEYFNCYKVESNPSISNNIHVLNALKLGGLPSSHPAVQKLARFLLSQRQAPGIWFDKWQISPYYATSHTILACINYLDELVRPAIAWLIHNQRPDGAWGYHIPTAEETAYALQALALWARAGNTVSETPLRRGANWLARHSDAPYPLQWIGKCLYSPELVVRSAVLSALALTMNWVE